MKLTVAAIFLSQSIPTLPSLAVQGRGTRSQSIILPQTLQSNEIVRAAQENRLTAAQRRIALYLNHLKGLSNGQPILKANVYCDPTSTDPDIGILSCGETHMCQGSLGAAEFGGICVPKPSAKKQKSTGNGFMGLLPKASKHVLVIEEYDAATNPVPCDPTLSDIGILACGQYNECQVNKSSQLGGFCSQSSTSDASRRLDTLYLCDETLPYIDDCDCSGVDNTTGTGIVYCSLYLEYPTSAACQGITLALSGSFTYENSVTTTYIVCYEMIAPYYQKICLTGNYSVAEKSCSLSLNSQECISCNTIYDCSNVEGGAAGQDVLQVVPNISECVLGISDDSINCTLCVAGDSMAYAYFDINVTIPGIGERSCGYLALVEYFALFPNDVCSVVSEAAQKSCCAYQCNLCGSRGYIPGENEDILLNLALPGYEDLTCGDFASAAYVNFSIPEGACASIAGVIQPTCCQTRRDECSLCNGPLTNPDANVTIEGNSVPCASLQSFLTAQECGGDVFSHVSPVCCSASVLSDPIEPPAVAPTSTTGTPTPTTPLEPTESGGDSLNGTGEAETPDAARSILTREGLLSCVGIVTVAFFLLVAGS